MLKTAKKLTAIVLSVALLASTLIISGILPVSAETDNVSPYPVYSDIDFSEYTVKGGASGNSYTGKYSDGSSAVYWKEVIDENADGGKYIRYDTTNVVEGGTAGATTWLGNHAFCPTETGERVILPVNTTFKVTFKIRTDAVEHGINGFVSFVDAPGSLNNVASGTVTWSSQYLAPSKEWNEYSFTFKTPETEKACYIGFNALDSDKNAVKVGYSYDIDHVKLEIINDANTRVIDFSKYVVANSGMWGPSEGENTSITDRWAHIYDDETLSGGKYYNYYGRVIEGNKGINTWYGHYGIAPTVEGSVSTSGDMTDPNNVVLPTSSTYRLTVRMRVNEVSGTTKLYRAFTVGQTTQGDATAIATLSASDEWVTYTDVFSTPEAYNVVSDKTYDRFYISVYNEAAGDMNFDIDYIKLEKVAAISVTFDANGGNFSGETTVTELAVAGDAIKTTAELSAPNKYSALSGWSTTADGNNIATKFTEEMDGTTLYAVWTKDPHYGGYESSVIDVTFANYTIQSGTNVFYFDDGQGNTKKPFFTKNPEADATTEDGNYLRYEALNGKGTSWMGNHALAISENGSKTPLPNGVTYEVTMRVRGNDLPASGMYPWYAFCDGLRGYSSSDYVTDTHFTAFTDCKVYESNEWTEIKFTLTTPDTYAQSSVTNTLFNNFFIGFYTGTSGVNYCYDLDRVTLKQVTKTNFYVDSDNNGEFELYSSAYGQPGAALSVPSSTSIVEVYNANGTGYLDTYSFTNWYSDEACTQSAVLKYGNFDVDLYCKPTVTTDNGKQESQVGFVGFDQYTEEATGWSINGTTASITKDEAYSGNSSLKLSVSSGVNASAELRNSDALSIKNGQTYRVTFKYKTDKDALLAVVTGKIGDVGSGKNLYGSEIQNISASDEWQTMSLLVNAENPVDPERPCNLAVVAGANDPANVYIDAVTVSTVTSAIDAAKTEEGIRFMMTYDCGGDNVISVEGTDYSVTEHGVLVTGADNNASLRLENAGANGIMKVNTTEVSHFFGRNEVTGITTYSVLLDGLAADDTYDFTARGFIKLSNGDVYYSDFVTCSAKDAKEQVDLTFPEEAILKGVSNDGVPYETTARDVTSESYFVYLPAGTTIYSEKTYYVERWLGVGTSWQSPNYYGNGTYVMTIDAYCELTVYDGSLNDDLVISVPTEVQHIARAGFKGTINATNTDFVLENASSSAANYIFISDVHTGAFLRNSAAGQLSVYEDESLILDREQSIISKMTDIVNYANSNDNIEFIVIGGDLVNGYETPDSPMYQKALAEGKVTNIREFVISQIQTILAPLKNSIKPVFVICGNHDDNRGQSLYYSALNAENGTSNPTNYLSEIVSDRDWYNGVTKEFTSADVVQDPNYLDVNGDKLSKYYYYDYQKNGEDKRVIVLDCMDTKNAMDPETGEILEYNGSRRMAYSADQLQWLAETLKSAKGDVVLFSHQPFIGEDTAYNSVIVEDILAAFQNKTSYVNDAMGINVNFGSNDGNVLSFHTGHTHEYKASYSSEAAVWQLVSSASRADIVTSSDKIVSSFSYGGADVKTYYYPDLG